MNSDGYVVDAKQIWGLPNLKELWRYRELLYFFVWREVKLRYKQTVIGVGWAVIQPLMTMAVFTIFFGNLAQVPSEGIPYPLFSFAALVPWTYFATSVTSITQGMVKNRRLITKIYFPREIIPLSVILSGLLDFAVAFVVLGGMLVFYRVHVTYAILFVPLLVFLMVLVVAGIGVWAAALNTVFRDVAYVMPFLMQVWLFATPVIYAASLVPEQWRIVYLLNPMVGVIEGFRWALLGVTTDIFQPIAASIIMSVILWLTAFIYFGHISQTIVDVI